MLPRFIDSTAQNNQWTVQKAYYYIDQSHLALLVGNTKNCYNYPNPMQFDDDRSNLDEDNIEGILEDLTVNDDVNNSCFVKRDNTFFIVDCSPEIMKAIPGEK